MSNLIRREDAISIVNAICDRCGKYKEYNGVMCGACTLDGVEDFIENLPSAEPKHGKWDIEISDDGYQATYHCSECGHRFKWIYDPHFPPVFNYCQKCGARMDG